VVHAQGITVKGAQEASVQAVGPGESEREAGADEKTSHKKNAEEKGVAAVHELSIDSFPDPFQ
jgi:hypothetical protein